MTNGITRREAITKTAGMVVSGTLAAGSAPPFGAARQPNFVFINIDDQAWNAMGHEGRFPFLKTPNMDRLAREGAKFENAFVTISLCSPSRACSLTGAYAHKHDVRENGKYDPHPALPTYPEVLQQHGYETAHIGKWHMQPRSGPRKGFDYWLSFLGQGEYIDPELNENGRDFKAKGYMTDLLTDYAVAWLKRPRTKPFCMNLWHKAVHGPFTPAPRHQDDWPNAELPSPPNWQDNLADKPDWMRRSTVYGARPHHIEAAEGKPTPEKLQPYNWNAKDTTRMNYLRALTAVDESLGRVLQTLEDMGELNNTVIIYTSDNGYFLGEHRRGDKRLAFEESMRIPLMIRYPKLTEAGDKIEPMALNIDVPVTILDMADAPIPDTMQGRSLVPLLKGNEEDWRDSFLYEYFKESWLPGIPTMLAVRTKDWKYITYPEMPDATDELYDLKNDPIEMHNLANDPEYAERNVKLKKELDRLLKKYEYGEPLPPRVSVPMSLALHYKFSEAGEGVVRDVSGNGFDGAITGAKPNARGTGLVFDGKAFVELLPPASGFDPVMKPLSMVGWATPASKDGVLASLGGETHGLSLFLKDGVPQFAVRSGGGLGHVAAKKPVRLGQRLHLAGVITGHPNMQLYVNGKLAGETTAPGFLPARPNETFTVGADLNTPVGEYQVSPFWHGDIEEVRLYYGALEPGQVGRWAEEK